MVRVGHGTGHVDLKAGEQAVDNALGGHTLQGPGPQPQAQHECGQDTADNQCHTDGEQRWQYRYPGRDHRHLRCSQRARFRPDTELQLRLATSDNIPVHQPLIACLGAVQLLSNSQDGQGAAGIFQVQGDVVGDASKEHLGHIQFGRVRHLGNPHK